MVKEHVALQTALSRPRWATYERLAHRASVNPVALYCWNMELCAALLTPLHICEVVMRNAIAAALAHRYGPCWPWHPALRRSLPVHSGLAALCNAQRSAHRMQAVPEIIAQLRFSFWQHLLAKRFEHAVWSKSMAVALPHAAPSPLAVLRASVHADLDRIRHLRNRIAHHEPILERDIGSDLAAIGRLIHARCPHTLIWLQRHERATTVLAASPLGRGL